TRIMFAFNPFIGVVAKSFNLFQKNFSGRVDSLCSALPIPGISGVSTQALGRPGLAGCLGVLGLTRVAGGAGGAVLTAWRRAGGVAGGGAGAVLTPFCWAGACRLRLGRLPGLFRSGYPPWVAFWAAPVMPGFRGWPARPRGGGPRGGGDATPFINIAMMA